MWLVSYKMGSISSTNNPSSAMYELILWPSFACLPLDFLRGGTGEGFLFPTASVQMLLCGFGFGFGSLFVVVFLLNFLSLSPPLFSCLSVTKQKKAKEMHLITQGAVVLV